jgi:hypothetical protein
VVAQPGPPCPWDSSLCLTAVRGNKLETLKRLRAFDPPCPWDADMCRAAAVHGAENSNWQMLKWMRAQTPPCPWHADVTFIAATQDHVDYDILVWLRQQDPPCPWTEGLIGDLVAIGELVRIKFLRSFDPPLPVGRGGVQLGCKGGGIVRQMVGAPLAEGTGPTLPLQRSDARCNRRPLRRRRGPAEVRNNRRPS